MRPGEASAAAEAAVASIDRQARILAIMHPLATTPYFLWFGQTALGNMRPPEMLLESIARVETLPDDLRTEIRFTANDVAVLCLWQEHRQVISPDPDLWAELSDTRTDMQIPAGLFDRMPYPDPFIVFPEPLVLPLDGGQYMTVRGFFVTGRQGMALQTSGGGTYHVGQMPVSLAISQVQRGGFRWYGLLFAAETWNADGTPIYVKSTGERDMIWTRLTIRDGASIDDLVAESMQNFLDTEVGGDARTHAQAMLRAAVSMMVYLCADNRDVRVINPPPVIVKRKGKVIRREKSTAPVVIEAGFRIGATIRKYRRERAAWQASNPTGRTMPPHLRAAHLQAFRVGPGRPNERTETIVKWVSFTEVNMGQRKGQPKTTVHRAASAKAATKERTPK